MMGTIDYYELLGVKPSAPADEVKAAYIKAVKAAHPDRGGTEALFRLVQEAGATLTDPARRAEYDKEREAPPEPTPPPPVVEDEWEPVPVEDAWQPVSETVAPPRKSVARYAYYSEGFFAPPVWWPMWARVAWGLGALPMFYFAALRDYQITEAIIGYRFHWWDWLPAIGLYVPVLAVLMVAYTLITKLRQKRWTIVVWLACWDNDLGFFGFLAVALYTIAGLMIRHYAGRLFGRGGGGGD
jgi:hypothetical protein